MQCFITKILSALIIVSVSAIRGFVLLENATVTFPTPLEELERIQLECEKNGVRGFDAVKDQYQRCLVSKGVKEAQVQGDTGTLAQVNCDAFNERRECWEVVAQKIDECVKGRGRTVQSIYTSFVQTTCANEDILRKLTATGMTCPVQNTVSASCKDVSTMASPNLCKSFNAQKICEESDIASCAHKEHKELLQKQFQEIATILGCGEAAMSTEKNSATKMMPPVIYLLLVGKILFKI